MDMYAAYAVRQRATAKTIAGNKANKLIPDYGGSRNSYDHHPDSLEGTFLPAKSLHIVGLTTPSSYGASTGVFEAHPDSIESMGLPPRSLHLIPGSGPISPSKTPIYRPGYRDTQRNSHRRQTITAGMPYCGGRSLAVRMGRDSIEHPRSPIRESKDESESIQDKLALQIRAHAMRAESINALVSNPDVPANVDYNLGPYRRGRVAAGMPYCGGRSLAVSSAKKSISALTFTKMSRTV